MEAEKAAQPACRRKVVMAAVKGDVHDIGKNIVVVLGCGTATRSSISASWCRRKIPRRRDRAAGRPDRARASSRRRSTRWYVASEMARRGIEGRCSSEAPRRAGAHGGEDRARRVRRTCSTPRAVGVVSALLDRTRLAGFDGDNRASRRASAIARGGPLARWSRSSMSPSGPPPARRRRRDPEPPAARFSTTSPRDARAVHRLAFLFSAWELPASSRRCSTIHLRRERARPSAPRRRAQRIVAGSCAGPRRVRLRPAAMTAVTSSSRGRVAAGGGVPVPMLRQIGGLPRWPTGWRRRRATSARRRFAVTGGHGARSWPRSTRRARRDPRSS
jgi:hypothetical protein